MQRVFSVWPVAQPVVGEMEMQCCQLSNIADPFSYFFPFKKVPKPSFWESPVLPHKREVLLSQRARTPLSLCVCSASLPACAHTSLSPSLSASAQFLSQRAHTPLSLCVCSVSLPARTHLSLSLSASTQFLSQRAHTPLSLCASAQFLSQRAHTSLSLSLRLLSFSSASGREEQRFS